VLLREESDRQRDLARVGSARDGSRGLAGAREGREQDADQDRDDPDDHEQLDQREGLLRA
jgi:hypothetical protein